MILPLLLLFAAQDAPPDCDNPVTQADMNECAVLRYQEADREMNKQWKVTLAAMRERGQAGDGFGPSSAQLLLGSQRAWLAYRDAQCRIEGDTARGGSMEPMLVSDCMTQLTLARTETLRELIEDQ